MTENIKEMIARAKANAAKEQAADILGTTAPIALPAGVIEPANPEGALLIVKELAVLGAQEAAIAAQKKRLTEALKILVGNNEGIRAGDMVLATIVRTHPVRLNSTAVQERFPYSEYPHLYALPKEETRLLVSPAVKAMVLAEGEALSIEEGK